MFKTANKHDQKSNQTLERYVADSELIERFISQQNDPRALTAKRLFDEVPFGIVKVYKTTRAGATVASCSESVRRRQLFTFIPRTNRIITKTVKEEVVNIVGRPINVIQIYRNSFCPKIAKRINLHPEIEKLGFIPLPNCDVCETLQCPVREAYETPVEKIDAFCLTYAKLISLVMAENERAKNLLDKITFNSKNIIFDEVQTLQEGTTVSVPIWGIQKGYEWNFNLQPYAKLKGTSPLIQRLLDKIAEIIDASKTNVEKLKNSSFKDHHKKHLSLRFENPAYKRNIEKIKKLQAEETKESERHRVEFEKAKADHPGESHIETALRIAEPFDSSISKALHEFQREDIPFSDITKIQEILINTIENPKEFGLNDDQIITLSKLLMIVNSDFFLVSFTRGLDSQQITLQAQDTLLFQSMKTFIKKALQQKSTEKRIIFTTATFGSLKIDKLLDLPNVIDWNWGDPLNTSSKLLVIADKAKISPYNFKFKLEHVVNLIKAIIDRFGEENVGICTMNKEWSADLQRFGIKSTWYQSDETEGVSSKKRVWIFAGLAYKPINAKDHLAVIQAAYHENPLNLQGEEFLYCVSQMLNLDSVNINTYQAISRAKDPEAKDRSLAIMIGARKEDVEKCLLWGPTRILRPEKLDKGLKFTVEVQDPIGKPLLTTAPLSTNIDESMYIFDQWINHGEVESYQVNWAYLKKLIDEKGHVSVNRLVKVNGLNEKDVQEFFKRLPTLFERQNVSDYVLLHDSNGQIKGVSTRQFYENKKKANILTRAPQNDSAIQANDWFITLKAVVDRAPNDLPKLNPHYFSQHVSAPMYAHLDEFMDSLELNPHLCTGWVVIGKKTDGRNNRRLVPDLPCFGAWAPDFPRSFGSPQQSWVENATELLQIAIESDKIKGDCFISVNAFPDHKHPKDGGNPPISSIFIDMDVESEVFSELKKRWQKGEDGCLEELKSLRLTLMTEVLKQAKALVAYLKTLGIEPRILLSGFKGVHIFVDFPTVQFSTPQAAKEIIRKFLEQISAGASEKSGCKVVFDPSVMGDISRLCRIPNTHNSKATKILGHNQYAVPMTAEELVNLTPMDYDTLCSATRYLPIQRNESLAVYEMLSKIGEEIDFEEEELTTKAQPAFNPKISVKNPKKIEDYEQECNREILADDDYDELDIRPCFKRVHSERMSLNGGAGNKMRIGVVMELARQKISIDSINRWFSFCNDYNANFTEKAIVDLISRGYTDKQTNEYGSEYRKGMRCETIQKCGFCLNDDCRIYQKKFGGR